MCCNSSFILIFIFCIVKCINAKHYVQKRLNTVESLLLSIFYPKSYICLMHHRMKRVATSNHRHQGQALVSICLIIIGRLGDI